MLRPGEGRWGWGGGGGGGGLGRPGLGATPRREPLAPSGPWAAGPRWSVSPAELGAPSPARSPLIAPLRDAEGLLVGSHCFLWGHVGEGQWPGLGRSPHHRLGAPRPSGRGDKADDSADPGAALGRPRSPASEQPVRRGDPGPSRPSSKTKTEGPRTSSPAGARASPDPSRLFHSLPEGSQPPGLSQN